MWMLRVPGVIDELIMRGKYRQGLPSEAVQVFQRRSCDPQHDGFAQCTIVRKGNSSSSTRALLN